MTFGYYSALRLGSILSSLTDAFTTRLLELAEQRQGPPPVPYVWLAGGSQGRQEQTFPTDQDNALLLDDRLGSTNEKYFELLSRFVCNGLQACGYEYCQGDAMAANANWRQPFQVWRSYFTDWIGNPEKKALMLASIFFDLRPVCGAVSLYDRLQQDILAASQRNGIFISYLVSNALTHRPPLGFFRQFDLMHDPDHDRSIDLKHRGVVPIVDIARILALSAGIAEINTTRRLLAAQNIGLLSQEMALDLLDALEYLSSVRLQHQARQMQRGETVDNYIKPDDMGGKSRYRLKRSFKSIKAMQQVLVSRHQAGLLR